MVFKKEDGIYAGQIRESWNFYGQKNKKTLVKEDIAIMMELLTSNGKNKEPIEALFTSLISIFASIEGFYEFFMDRFEIFNIETKSNNKIRHNTKRAEYREAYNDAGIKFSEYAYQVYRIAGELANRDIQNSVGVRKEHKYEYKIVKVSNSCGKETTKNTSEPEVKEIETKNNHCDYNDKALKSNAFNTENIELLVVDETLKQQLINDYESNRRKKIKINVEKNVKKHYGKNTLAYNILFKADGIVGVGSDEAKHEEQEVNINEKVTKHKEEASKKIELKEAIISPMTILAQDPASQAIDLDKFSDKNTDIDEYCNEKRHEYHLMGYDEEKIEEKLKDDISMYKKRFTESDSFDDEEQLREVE